MDTKIEFAVFCIESLAERIGTDGARAYELLAGQTDTLTSYILPNCETLHTRGKAYITDELIDVLREKGVAL